MAFAAHSDLDPGLVAPDAPEDVAEDASRVNAEVIFPRMVGVNFPHLLGLGDQPLIDQLCSFRVLPGRGFGGGSWFRGLTRASGRRPACCRSL